MSSSRPTTRASRARFDGSGVRVAMTRADHASGSDRLAECAAACGWSDDTIVVNLQGDEPLAPASGIRTVAAALAESDAPMATLATPMQTIEELFDPNCVKVVADASGHALYFSRAPVPWPRDAFARGRDTLPEDVRRTECAARNVHDHRLTPAINARLARQARRAIRAGIATMKAGADMSGERTGRVAEATTVAAPRPRPR